MYILFSQYRSRHVLILRRFGPLFCSLKESMQAYSCLHALFLMSKTKNQSPWVLSHDLYWENKMYKRKRSIRNENGWTHTRHMRVQANAEFESLIHWLERWLPLSPIREPYSLQLGYYNDSFDERFADILAGMSIKSPIGGFHVTS